MTRTTTKADALAELREAVEAAVNAHATAEEIRKVLEDELEDLQEAGKQ